MDVLVAGDQVGVLGGTCGRFQLVPRQHPNLPQEKKKKKHKQVVCGEKRDQLHGRKHMKYLLHRLIVWFQRMVFDRSTENETLSVQDRAEV